MHRVGLTCRPVGLIRDSGRDPPFRSLLSCGKLDSCLSPGLGHLGDIWDIWVARERHLLTFFYHLHQTGSALASYAVSIY